MPSDKLFIDLITETKKSVKNLLKYTAGVAALIITVKKFITIAKKLEQAYFVQERAETKLSAAIQITGKSAEISLSKMKKLASGLQDVAKVGDEVTLSAMAMVQQLANLNERELTEITPLILDFAKGMRIDVVTAATLVGKTIGSTTNALTRYGIEIDTSADKTDKIAELITVMDNKFGGLAEQMGKTTEGIDIGLKNSLGDLREEMGRVIAEGTTGFKMWLTGVVTNLAEASKQAGLLTASFKDFAFIGGTSERQLAQFDSRIEQLTASISELNTVQEVGLRRARSEGVSGTTLRRLATEEAVVKRLSEQQAELRGIARARADVALQIAIQNREGEVEIARLAEVARKARVFAEEMERLNEAFMGTPEGKEFALLAAIQDFSEFTLLTNPQDIERVAIVIAHLRQEYEDLIKVTTELTDKEMRGFIIGTELPKDASATIDFMAKVRDRNDEINDSLIAQADIVAAAAMSWGDFTEIIEENAKAIDRNRAIAELAAEREQAAYVNMTQNIGGAFFDLWEAVNESSGKSAQERFRVAQSLALAEIAFNTAVAISKVFPNPLLMVGAGALGALQAGAVLAQAPPALGEGGIVTRPTLALIGEKGPERVTPLTGPNRGGDTFITHIHAGTILAERGLRAIIQDEQRRSRRVH